MNDPQSDTPRDPIAHAAELVSPNDSAALEERIKRDVFNSIGRIKPDVVAKADFEKDVLAGEFFAGLSAPLQGIAIARTEGVLAFYNRVGWNPAYLTAPLSAAVPDERLPISPPGLRRAVAGRGAGHLDWTYWTDLKTGG